jgi:hypothetical protein
MFVPTGLGMTGLISYFLKWRQMRTMVIHLQALQLEAFSWQRSCASARTRVMETFVHY